MIKSTCCFSNCKAGNETSQLRLRSECQPTSWNFGAAFVFMFCCRQYRSWLCHANYLSKLAFFLAVIISDWSIILVAKIHNERQSLLNHYDSSLYTKVVRPECLNIHSCPDVFVFFFKKDLFRPCTVWRETWFREFFCWKEGNGKFCHLWMACKAWNFFLVIRGSHHMATIV